MKVTEIKNEGLELHCHVIVPASKLSEVIDTKLEELSKTVKLPGFRPGKVPLKIIEKKYRASVLSEALQGEIEHQVSHIIKDKKLKLAAQAQVEDVKFEDGKDVEFKVIFEKMPEITFPDLAKLKLVKPVVKIKASEVDEKIKEFLAFKAPFKAAAKTAKASDKDKVIIDFEGFLDGKAFPGGKGENHGLILGSNSFIPGFEAQLIGKKAGDETTVKVTFPTEYGEKTLAGKATEFKVKIHEVQKPEKLEINDELAKEVGAKDLAGLKANIEKMLSRNFEEQSYVHQKMELFNQLENLLTFDIPKSLLERELLTLRNQVKELKDEDPKLKGKSEKELEKYSEKIALRRIRIGLFLSEYANVNKITPTTDDFRAAIMQQARSYPGSEKEIFDFYQKNPKALQSLAGPILEDKAVKELVEKKVKVTEKEYTQEAFEKLMEESE